MNSYKRNGNRWTVNELLTLQREYELLGWTIQEIAGKHERSVDAILYRLESEGFIDSWNDARGFDMETYKTSIDEDDISEVGISEVDKLTERVWGLETSVADIKDMVQHLFNNLVSSNKQEKNTKKQTTQQNQR
jgi:hypothetical protein